MVNQIGILGHGGGVSASFTVTGDGHRFNGGVSQVLHNHRHLVVDTAEQRVNLRCRQAVGVG